MQLANRLIGISALVLALTACSGVETTPADVSIFAAGNYHYYRWRSEPMTNTTNSTDTMYRLDPVLREAINASLASKGYALDPQRARFNVDYIFAPGVRQGVKGAEASNLSTHPGVIPNRDIDQASIDNAYALGGLKETRNIGIQFNDIGRKEEVWHVTITKLVENANSPTGSGQHSAISSVVNKAMESLPQAKQSFTGK
ncbi:MAG: hypothetical protein ACI8QT_001567 [Halioglobus sp.]|jgi:hypothetical protein